MFRHKKKQNQSQEEEPKPVKKHWLRKTIKYFCLFILAIFICAAGAVVWLLESQKGQALVVETVNSVLGPKDHQDGLSFKITSLSGSLPFNFEIGLESYDKHGLWLAAPQNTFTLNWRELPRIVHISALKCVNLDLSRFPDLPPDTTPAEPSAPFTLADAQKILKQGADFLASDHWWLPQVKIDGVAIENALLPAAILPQKDDARLKTDLAFNFTFTQPLADTFCRVDVANNNGKPIAVPNFTFQNLNVQLTANAGLDKNKTITAKTDLQTTLRKPELALKDVPSDILGDDAVLSLTLNVLANSDVNASLQLAGPNLTAGKIKLHNSAHWQSGPEWPKGEIDGSYDYDLSLAAVPLSGLAPDSPLAILRAPLNLALKISGDLPDAKLDLSLACSELAKDDHAIKNVNLNIAAPKVELPLNGEALKALQKEQDISLILKAELDQSPIALTTRLFFNSLLNSAQEIAGWNFGMHDLDLDALGAQIRGNLKASMLNDHLPSVNGSAQIDIDKWDAVSKFVPGSAFAGDVKIGLELSSPNPGNLPAKVEPAQAANVHLAINNFNMRSDGKEVVAVKNLEGSIKATNLYDVPHIDALISSRGISAADMAFDAKIKANGSVQGPLTAEVSTSGSVATKIACQWQPGQVILNTLDVSMSAAKFLSSAGKAAVLGVRSAGRAEITYGEKGLGCRNVDLRLLPSGRLLANGGLAPDKLNFNLELKNLDLKPWQSLVSPIPLGIVNLQARLQGTPKQPSGNFKVGLADIKIPDSPLPPLSLALNGNIRNSGPRSALEARLELAPKSVKALGGNTAAVSASVPLLFSADGIPNVNMDGNVAAQVRWNGALGPLWNLAPVADQRLNGRLNINIDANGKLRAPHIKGGVTVDNARYENVQFGVLITNIALRLNLLENNPFGSVNAKGAIDSLPGGMSLTFNATDGRGGTIKVDGKGSLDGANLDIKAAINKLRPLRRRDIFIELSGKAQVTGSALNPLVDGEIIVNKGEVLLDNLEIVSSSVTTLPITVPGKQQQKEPAKEESHKELGKLNVKFNMLPRFTVEGRGLTSIWAANLLIEGSLDNPHITGNIHSVKGNFDFLGKDFILSKGIVFFGGGSISNPLLDIELTNETPDLTAHILITGPVDKMKLTLTSDPSLPRDEILSQVLFGKSVSDLTRLEALQLAASVAQLAGFGSSNGILTFAKKALGVDVLRLGTASGSSTGEPGDQTAGGTTIEMGKYINDMIYMGVQQGLKPDSTAFIIQLELTPRTTLELETEQNNTWGGIKWKYNY